MAKKKLKNRLIVIFLCWILILLLPDWIKRHGWNNVPGMAWFWLGIFLVCLFVNFIEDYSENQKIKEVNKMVDDLKKRLK